MQSSSASLIYKILAVFLLFCLSKASGGTCLSYGHSCWGGHGKRNGANHLFGPTNSQKRTSEWYISRMFNPPLSNSKKIETILKTPNVDSEETDKFHPFGYQIYPVSDGAESNIREEPMESDGSSKTTKWGSEANESEEEVVVLTPDIRQEPVSKYRLYQIMSQDVKKRGAK